MKTDQKQPFTSDTTCKPGTIPHRRAVPLATLFVLLLCVFVKVQTQPVHRLCSAAMAEQTGVVYAAFNG